MSVWDVFRERGFFQQATDMDALEAESGKGPITGYIGFDPTADSFHAGHLIPLMALLHFQREGHRPIALLGGGTAMIGDPTGKNEMRKMLSVEELDANIESLRGQIDKLFEFGQAEQRPQLVNNAEWLRGLHYIDFLREIGPHFSVKRMLTFETFKLRMEAEGEGLSFIEFNYPLLQSYDFLELSRRHGCVLQMGGDDQWANIISGMDLVRRMDRKTVYGLTFPLLTLASGAKMGKTAAGAVWLNEDKLSAYDYWQYWRNTEDADVGRFLRLFTELPEAEIAKLEALKGAEIVLLGYNTPSVLPWVGVYEDLSSFHNHLSMQAGAYQNAMWVVGVAKAGVEEGCNLIGGSCIVAPSGEIVALARTKDDELITAVCDLDECRHNQKTLFNFAEHRRIEHYGIIASQAGVIPPD